MYQYYICKKCNGQGETDKYTILNDVKTGLPMIKTKFCIYCRGKGKLDWIEHIKGISEIDDPENTIQKHWSTKWI